MQLAHDTQNENVAKTNISFEYIRLAGGLASAS